MNPTYYYQWGNEEIGYVSTGFYDPNGVWRECDKMKIEDAKNNGLTFHNPHP